MSEVTCLRLAEEFAVPDRTSGRSKRLEILREQFQRANRRASGPFSHPYATRGSLSKLREQIRDVSRIADAVLLNAETASDHRLNDLCNDLKSLLHTQQNWTDRLENQIWRLESQSSLMQRLKSRLLDHPPGNEELWELCEVIARETQSLPSGLFLLPEPGHNLILAEKPDSIATSQVIEEARLAVYSGLTMLPNIRGADIVAQTFQAASASRLPRKAKNPDDSTFSQLGWLRRTAIADPSQKVCNLINATQHYLAAVECRSQTAVDRIVPPAIADFFGDLSEILDRNPALSPPDKQMAHAISRALGLVSEQTPAASPDAELQDDGAVVLTHKLRWHEGSGVDFQPRNSSLNSHRIRPSFAASGLPATSLTVFVREE